MKLPNSKIGLALSVLYLAVSLYLIATQGLFGESFIALLLGLPWSYLIVLLEHYKLIPINLSLHVELLAPIGANAILLYWIGGGIQRAMTMLARHGVSRRDQ